MCSTIVQVEVAPNVKEGQTSNSCLTMIVAMQAPPQPLPEPQPHMSNRNWILDLMEVMDVNDDHEHNSDYASISTGK